MVEPAKELLDTLKDRLSSPIFGPIVFTFIFWNFNPIYTFLYYSVRGWIVPQIDLYILHESITYWQPIVIGIIVMFVRRPTELVMKAFLLYCEAVFDRYKYRYENPSLNLKIINLEKIVKTEKEYRMHQASFMKLFSFLELKEERNKVALLLQDIDSFDLAEVSTDVEIGNLVTYNPNLHQYVKFTSDKDFNGILLYRLDKYGIIGNNGLFRRNLFKETESTVINSGNIYTEDRTEYRAHNTKTILMNYADTDRIQIRNIKPIKGIGIVKKKIGFE